MAKLPRVLARVFGSSAGTDQISQFGSLAAGSPAFSTDPSVVQSLSNWVSGWFSAVIGGNAPAIEDMNAAMFVITYQLAYVMQAGIPEWDTSTVYYTGSLVNDGTGSIYSSRTDNNQGNALTSSANWIKVGGAVTTTLGDTVYGGTNGDLTRLGGNTTTDLAILSQTGDGAASAAPAWRRVRAPTIQKFLSGSGTYTTPTSPAPLYLRVKMVGGGGGGSGGGSGGSSAQGGGDGGNTTFGSAFLVANGGKGSPYDGPPGAGGSASIGAGAVGIALTGADGNGGGNATGTTALLEGAPGASTPLGGGGPGGPYGQPPTAAVDNTGAGGGGGGGGAGTLAGFGGAAGGFVEAIVASPSATYAFVVGAGGAFGLAATSGGHGGAGAKGTIIVEEHYI